MGRGAIGNGGAIGIGGGNGIGGSDRWWERLVLGESDWYLWKRLVIVERYRIGIGG